MRVIAALALVIAAGCACESEPRTRDAGRPPPSAPAPLDAQQQVAREWLRAQAISTTHFGAPVLYAWLTADELDAVRAGASIAAYEEPEDARLDDETRFDTRDVAALIRARSGRRRAWPSPWASRDWDPRADHLVRIELRPESLLLVYDLRTTPPEIRFSTERGVAAPYDEAVQLPELWAAALVVSTDHREYVLLSPDMIGRVSAGSPEIASELRTERERLTRLAHDLPEVASWMEAPALRRAWSSAPDEDATLAELYGAVVTARERSGATQSEVSTLVSRLTETSDAFEWRTTLSSEARPHFFE